MLIYVCSLFSSITLAWSFLATGTFNRGFQKPLEISLGMPLKLEVKQSSAQPPFYATILSLNNKLTSGMCLLGFGEHVPSVPCLSFYL